MSNVFANLTVLIVDDHEPVVTLLAEQLSALGVGTIYTSNNAEDAYQIALATSPDILLVDWELGDSSGLDLTRWIRNHKTHDIRTAPIILTSGYTARYRLDNARDSGITEYLAKPFTYDELARAIAYVIENPRDFIETDTFFGPDRRRAVQTFTGPDRRSGSLAGGAA